MSTQTMASISNAISALPAPYPRVSLIKHYKGTTLNLQGRIIAIDPNSAMIQATQRLTFPILDGMIHMRSKSFSGAITATIHPVDYAQGTFQLSELSYGEWRERKSERVQPKYPTYLAVNYGGVVYRSFLMDISTNGMGILVNRSIHRGSGLHTGAKILLDFQLEPAFEFKNIYGSIVYWQEVGQQLIKLGLTIFPDRDQEADLKTYIHRRHEEILAELKQDSICLREPCRVENLYF